MGAERSAGAQVLEGPILMDPRWAEGEFFPRAPWSQPVLSGAFTPDGGTQIGFTGYVSDREMDVLDSRWYVDELDVDACGTVVQFWTWDGSTRPDGSPEEGVLLDEIDGMRDGGQFFTPPVTPADGGLLVLLDSSGSECATGTYSRCTEADCDGPFSGMKVTASELRLPLPPRYEPPPGTVTREIPAPAISTWWSGCDAYSTTCRIRGGASAGATTCPAGSVCASISRFDTESFAAVPSFIYALERAEAQPEQRPEQVCSPWTIIPCCGDGHLDTANRESCDDGNRASSDGCSRWCQVEPPRNGWDLIHGGDLPDSTVDSVCVNGTNAIDWNNNGYREGASESLWRDPVGGVELGFGWNLDELCEFEAAATSSWRLGIAGYVVRDGDGDIISRPGADTLGVRVPFDFCVEGNSLSSLRSCLRNQCQRVPGSSDYYACKVPAGLDASDRIWGRFCDDRPGDESDEVYLSAGNYSMLVDRSYAHADVDDFCLLQYPAPDWYGVVRYRRGIQFDHEPTSEEVSELLLGEAWGPAAGECGPPPDASHEDVDCVWP